MTKPRILVAVCSWEQEVERRQVVRETWASEVVPGIKVIFFSGGPPTEEKDVWFLDVEDSYEALTQKSRAMLTRALTIDWDWLFKVDTDSMVRLSRLHSLIPPDGWDLVGNEFLTTQRFASGGAGYFLSRKAVEVVVADDSKAHFRKGEDVAITQTAIAHGMRDLASSRLIWHQYPCPSPDNDLITSHHLTIEELREIHAKFS